MTNVDSPEGIANVVWVAVVNTEACDQYVFAYSRKPAHAEIIERAWQIEGAADLEWYNKTLRVVILQTEMSK